MKLKICIFAHDAYMSGANMSLCDWVNEDKKDDIYIILPHKNSNFDNINKNIHLIDGRYFVLVRNLEPTNFMYNCKKSIKTLYMKSFYRYVIREKLRKTISSINPDVIISNSFSIWLGADIAESLNIPHIWYIREFMELDHKITHNDPDKIKRLAQGSYAIFISKSIKEYYENKYSFLGSQVVYDQVKYNPNLLTNVKRFTSKNIKIIFAGTLQRGKGVLTTINAVNELIKKDYKLEMDIYGKGPLEKEISDYLNNKHINGIKLKGYSKNLSIIRKNYDLALICSEMEALGRVTIEAMYYRNLVLGANRGGTVELVQNEKNGFLYDVNDIGDLEKKIIDIITLSKEDNNKINKIIGNAQKYAISNFSQNIAPQIIDFIKKVI